MRPVKQETVFFFLIFFLILCALIVGCSRGKVMRNCQEIGQNFYECEEP